MEPECYCYGCGAKYPPLRSDWPETISPEEQIAYAAQIDQKHSQCPRCGSRDLDQGNYDGDQELSCTVRCNDCKLAWTEIYKFAQSLDFVHDN